MASLRARLEKLENVQRPGGRCPVCRLWPAQRVIYVNPISPDEIGDEIPEACPRCGWKPDTVRIEYVDELPVTTVRHKRYIGIDWSQV